MEVVFVWWMWEANGYIVITIHLVFPKLVINTLPLSNAWRMALSMSLDDPRLPMLNSKTVTRSRFFKVSFTISQWLTRFFFPKFSSTWFLISASTEASNIVCVLLFEWKGISNYWWAWMHIIFWIIWQFCILIHTLIKFV